MPTLDARIRALETKGVTRDSTFVVLHYIVTPGQERREVNSAHTEGKTLRRDPGEAEATFVDRVRAWALEARGALNRGAIVILDENDLDL